MTPGDQMLNLTHVDEIADAILTETENLLVSDSKKQHVYELKSQTTKSLKDIIMDINSFTSYEIEVAWGAVPYRTREVFDSWDTGLETPKWWSPKINFLSWLESLNLQNSLKG
jgi:hypothetical protein